MYRTREDILSVILNSVGALTVIGILRVSVGRVRGAIRSHLIRYLAEFLMLMSRRKGIVLVGCKFSMSNYYWFWFQT